MHPLFNLSNDLFFVDESDNSLPSADQPVYRSQHWKPGKSSGEFPLGLFYRGFLCFSLLVLASVER